MVGFAVVYLGLGAQFRGPADGPGFATLVYLSGVTFFTLGYGDLVLFDPPGQTVAILDLCALLVATDVNRERPRA